MDIYTETNKQQTCQEEINVHPGPHLGRSVILMANEHAVPGHQLQAAAEGRRAVMQHAL